MTLKERLELCAEHAEIDECLADAFYLGAAAALFIYSEGSDEDFQNMDIEIDEYLARRALETMPSELMTEH